jgi:hypothetical protein
MIPWESTSVLREGYLVSGEYQHSECVDGEAHTAQYSSGGYVYRPPNAINGGPEAAALTESVWLLREKTTGVVTTYDDCVKTAPIPDL